jgi:hypothetical protein
MSKMHEELSPETQRQLDRLVDGELSDVERRQLLDSFDEQPVSWRRCALAFLEAQSWRRQMRHLGQATSGSFAASTSLAVPPRRREEGFGKPRSPASHEGRKVEVASRGSRRHSAAGLYFAVAASFLVAFGLAWVIRQPATGLVAVEDANVAAPALPALASADPTAENGFPSGGRRPWEPVTLVMDGGPNGDAREIELPVMEAMNTDELERDLREPAVPAALRDALERMGHHVEEHRQFIPVDLRDGRQMVVPVDDIEFLPVSARTYQ